MLEVIRGQPDINTARLVEKFRDSGVHAYLEKLAVHPTSIDQEALQRQFNDTLMKLVEQGEEQRRFTSIGKSQAARVGAGGETPTQNTFERS